MSVNQSWNNTTYPIPTQGDLKWGPPLTRYLVALGSFALSPAGGSFPLTADINFGTSFGVLAPYFKSATANIATLGTVRMAKTDTIDWRNNANSGNNILAVNGSDQLTYNGTPVAVSGGGTVNLGTAGNIPYYAATGTVLSDSTIAAANLALLAGSPQNFTGLNTFGNGASSPRTFFSSDAVPNTPNTYNLGAINNAFQDIWANRFAIVDNSSGNVIRSIYGSQGTSPLDINYPDVNSATAQYVLDKGTQTLTGAKTFSSTLTMSGATIAMGSNKITGLAAGTTSGDALAYGQSGAALTSPVLTTPTIGAASATSINFGGQSLSTYATGTWTPSDQSGAGLTFTVTTAKYVKIGNVVFIECFLTFPSTASGASNQIGGLPFSVDDESMSAMRTNSSRTDSVRFLSGTSNFQMVVTNGGAVATNAQLTTEQVIFTGFYFHA